MARLNSEINVTLKGIREFLQDLKKSNEEVKDLRKKIDKLDEKIKKMGKAHKKDMEKAAKAYEKEMTKAIKTVDKKANRLSKILSKAKGTVKEFAFESLAVFTGGSLGEFASVLIDGLGNIVEEGKDADKQLGQIAKSAGKLKNSLGRLGTSFLKFASGAITFATDGLSDFIDALAGASAAIIDNKKELGKLEDTFRGAFDSILELEGELRIIALEELNKQIQLVNGQYNTQIGLLTEASSKEDILAAKASVRAAQEGRVVLNKREQLQAGIALVNAERSLIAARNEQEDGLRDQIGLEEQIADLEAENLGRRKVMSVQDARRIRILKDELRQVKARNEGRKEGLETLTEELEEQKKLLEGGPFTYEFLLSFAGSNPDDKDLIDRILKAIDGKLEIAITLEEFSSDIDAYQSQLEKIEELIAGGRIVEAQKELQNATVLRKKTEETISESVDKRGKAELEIQKRLSEAERDRLKTIRDQFDLVGTMGGTRSSVFETSFVFPSELIKLAEGNLAGLEKSYTTLTELNEELNKNVAEGFKTTGGLFKGVMNQEVLPEAIKVLTEVEKQLLRTGNRAADPALYDAAVKKLNNEFQRLGGRFLTNEFRRIRESLDAQIEAEEAKLEAAEAGLRDRDALNKKYQQDNLKILQENFKKQIELEEALTEEREKQAKEAAEDRQKRFTSIAKLNEELGTVDFSTLEEGLNVELGKITNNLNDFQKGLEEKVESFNETFGSTFIDADEAIKGNIPDISDPRFSGLDDAQKELANEQIQALRANYLQLLEEQRAYAQKRLRAEEQFVQNYIKGVIARNRKELEETKRAYAQNLQEQERQEILIGQRLKILKERQRLENRGLTDAEKQDLKLLYEDLGQIIAKGEELNNKIKIEKYTEAVLDLKDRNFDVKAEEEKLTTERLAIQNDAVKKAIKIWDEYFGFIKGKQKEEKEDEPDYTAMAQEITDGFVNLLDAFINYQLTIAEAAAERVAEQLDFVEERLSETQSRINDLEADLEGKRSGRRDAVLRAIETEKQREKQLLEERKRLMKEQERLEKAAAEKRKVAAISQAVVNGAVAITRILAETPKGDFGVMTAIQIALASAMTGLQIATIQAQQFREGGLLEGPSHENGGIPFTIAGRPGFEAEGGEFIVNRESTAMFLPLLQALNDKKSLGANTKFEEGGVLPNYDGLSQSFLGDQARSLDTLSNIGQDNVYVDITEIENLLIKRARVTGISRI